MDWNILLGTCIPLFGTLAGSSAVLFMKGEMKPLTERVLAGFAAGVMVAASVWSLIIPAIEQAENLGKLACLPAFAGFWLGILFLLALDEFVPHIHAGSDEEEGISGLHLKKRTMMMFAVTLHNLPEGMAVGAVFAAMMAGGAGVSLSSALALSLGIAIQNIPEGAIISLPLHAAGAKKSKAFLLGTLSGLVEPVGSWIMIALAHVMIPFMPYFLSFAAGAMMYVVVEELIPQMQQGDHSNWPAICFAAGFSLMMILDVALG